jgi:hypothetical protein
VVVRVPVAALALAAEPWAHSGQLTVYAAAGSLGSAATVEKAVLPVRIPHEQIMGVLGREVETTLDLDVPAGADAVAVGIRDDFAPAWVALRRPIPVPGTGP